MCCGWKLSKNENKMPQKVCKQCVDSNGIFQISLSVLSDLPASELKGLEGVFSFRYGKLPHRTQTH